MVKLALVMQLLLAASAGVLAGGPPLPLQGNGLYITDTLADGSEQTTYLGEFNTTHKRDMQLVPRDVTCWQLLSSVEDALTAQQGLSGWCGPHGLHFERFCS